jgi:hypothetical protein
MNRLQSIIANKHTRGGAAVFVLAKILCRIGIIWLPDHKAQFEATADVIESGSVAWIAWAAGDANAVDSAVKPGKIPPV